MDPSAKTLLRRKVRERIADLGSGERREADAAIAVHLLRLRRELGSEAVLGYLALGDEARIDNFLTAAVADGCTVLLPVSVGGSLVLRAWRPTTQLGKDAEGVLAPTTGPDFRLPLDGGRGGLLVVSPGRAFDRFGGRLGRGGGYYDRLLGALAGRGQFVVGAGYGCQMFDAVPMESHDARIGGVVTERGFEAARAA